MVLLTTVLLLFYSSEHFTVHDLFQGLPHHVFNQKLIELPCPALKNTVS